MSLALDLPCIPRNEPYEGSQLIGYVDIYDFDEVLSKGSQGYVVKYKSSGGLTALIKFFDYDKQSASTQTRQAFERANPMQTPEYHAFAEEVCALSHLNVAHRIIEYTKTRDIKITESGILDNGYNLSPDIYAQTGSNFFDLEKLINSPNAYFPIEIDWISQFVNNKGEKFFPIANPCNNLAVIPDYLLNATPLSPITPVYHYEEGNTLNEIIGTRPLKHLSIELLKAIATLHHLGIIHRDLCPNNIYITKNNKIKIIDFGISKMFAPSDRIAKIAEKEQTPLKARKIFPSIFKPLPAWGSRFFSPPEMYKDKISNKIDIYSAGMIAALLWTLEHPLIPEYKTVTKKQSKKLNKSRKVARLMQTYEHQHARINISKKYKKYVSRFQNDEFIQKIKDTFNPKVELRPNRMSLVLKKFDLSIDMNCPIIDSYELFGNQKLARDYETEILRAAATKKRVKFTPNSLWSYRNAHLHFQNYKRMKKKYGCCGLAPEEYEAYQFQFPKQNPWKQKKEEKQITKIEKINLQQTNIKTKFKPKRTSKHWGSKAPIKSKRKKKNKR